MKIISKQTNKQTITEDGGLVLHFCKSLKCLAPEKTSAFSHLFLHSVSYSITNPVAFKNSTALPPREGEWEHKRHMVL